jgi:hypothetical protein
MNCERVQEALLAALAGERPQHSDADVTRHLQSCAACRDANADYATLWANLGTLADTVPPPHLRPRIDAAVAAWRDGRYQHAPRRAASHWAAAAGWFAGIARAVARVRPLPLAGAAALAVACFALGHVAALRSDRMQALQRDLQSTRSLMALSLLQQRSAVDRLNGVSWSSRVQAPDAALLDVLFETIETDPNVDVRLAAVEALGGIEAGGAISARLRRALPRQDSPLVQIAIIDVLAMQRDPAAQPLLRAVASDSLADDAVRERARRADHQLTM